MTSASTPTSAAAPGEAARSPQKALAAPIRLEGPRPRPSARLRLAALLAALAGHGGVLYWVAREPPDSLAGGHGQVLAAVNVTVVSSAVIESRSDHRAPPAPALDSAVEAKDGSLESPPRPKSAEQKQEAAEAKAVPQLPAPDDALAKAPPKAPEPPQEQEKERKEASPAAEPVGGASARGEAPSATKQNASAAASPGAVREYANAVQRALARARPKGPRGFTVRVKLLVSSDGRIETIEIFKSSGNKNLDAAVLTALRPLKLPTPPPGLAFEERWYEFPVHFR